MNQIKLFANNALRNTVSFTYDYNGVRVAKTETTGVAKRRYFNQYAESANGSLTLYYYLGTRMVSSYTRAYPSLSEVNPALIVEPERIDLPPPLLVLFASGVLLMLVAPVGRHRIGVRVSIARAAAVACILLTTSAPVVLFSGCGAPPDVKHYHIDRLGTVQAVSDFNGNLSHQVRYAAYGQARGRFDGAGNPVTLGVGQDGLRHEFTGYETDVSSGLEYAGARWFDPELGQFQSLDPQRQFPSPYAYGPGDPVNGTDPTGEDFGLLALAIIVIAAVASAIDTYNQTGDLGAAFQSFALSIAGSVVGIGVSFVAGTAVNGIAGTIADEGIQAAVLETYQSIETYGGYTAGAYGVADSLSDGRPFSAGVAIGMMAYGILSAEAASGQPSQDDPAEIQGKIQDYEAQNGRYRERITKLEEINRRLTESRDRSRAMGEARWKAVRDYFKPDSLGDVRNPGKYGSDLYNDVFTMMKHVEAAAAADRAIARNLELISRLQMRIDQNESRVLRLRSRVER